MFSYCGNRGCNAITSSSARSPCHLDNALYNHQSPRRFVCGPLLSRCSRRSTACSGGAPGMEKRRGAKNTVIREDTPCRVMSRELIINPWFCSIFPGMGSEKLPAGALIIYCIYILVPYTPNGAAFISKRSASTAGSSVACFTSLETL